MIGGAKASSRISAAADNPSRTRGGGETIAEVAAIARRAASHGGEPAPVAASVSSDANEQAPHHTPSGGDMQAEPSPEAEIASVAETLPPPDPALSRRTRAGAGLQKEPVQGASADRTAVHLILAGRAYAYGQRIVHKDEGKLGDVLAIKS